MDDIDVIGKDLLVYDNALDEFNVYILFFSW